MTAGLTDGLGTTERATRFGPKIHVTAGTLPSAVFGAVDDVRTPLVPAVGAVEPALYFRSVYRSLTDENGAEPTTLDRLPVSTWLRTPPVDLAGARDAENFTPRGPVGQVAPKPLLDMGGFRSCRCRSSPSQLRRNRVCAGTFDLRPTGCSLYRRHLQRDLPEYFVSTDRTSRNGNYGPPPSSKIVVNYHGSRLETHDRLGNPAIDTGGNWGELILHVGPRLGHAPFPFSPKILVV